MSEETMTPCCMGVAAACGCGKSESEIMSYCTCVQKGKTMKTEALKDWHFEYEPETRFVGASHPMGGKFSVVRIELMPMSGLNPDDIGNAIADMLNGKERP